MNVEQFIKQRVDDQINWYDRKSQFNQRWYKNLRIAEIVAAAAIPFLAGNISTEIPAIQFIVGFLGFLIAVIAGVVGLYQFQERWVEYRTTCESLRHEKYLYLTKSEPYNVQNPFPLFVQRAESLISVENTRWSQLSRTQKKERKNS
jgi:hypothetical protein